MEGRKLRALGWGLAVRHGLLVMVALVVAVAGAATAAATGWSVGPRLFSFAPPCLFHHLTGLHCPGCGGTRAVDHLLRGEPLAALRSNPLLLVALPLLFLAVLPVPQSRTAGSRGAALRRIAYSPAVGWGFAAVTVLFGILRNVPFGPFRWLAP